jgi:hypothetical protein
MQRVSSNKAVNNSLATEEMSTGVDLFRKLLSVGQS